MHFKAGSASNGIGKKSGGLNGVPEREFNGRLNIDLLENVRPASTGRTARCPACSELGEDKKGNHLWIGSDGRFGCVTNPGGDGHSHRQRIFELAGIIDDQPSKALPVETKKPEKGPVPRPLDDLIEKKRASIDSTGDVTVTRLEYSGSFVVVRFDFEVDGVRDKTFRPYSRSGDGWICKAPASQPLWNLAALTERPSELVVFHEGEKCCQRLEGILGYLSTTCAGGSGADLGKVDLTPLAGRNVVIIADNDEPGRRYVEKVRVELEKLEAPAFVRVIEKLPGGDGNGDDAADWIDRGIQLQKTVDEMRAEFDALVKAAPDVNSPCFVDLGELVRQGLPREYPKIAAAFDRKCLLYEGRLNEVHGEPATGKTNVACAMAVSEVRSGGTVLFLDPEDTPQGIAGKLASFGLTDAELSTNVRYVHNPAPEDYVKCQLWAKRNKCSLVVCDGLAEAMAAEGYDEDKPRDVLQFFRERLRPFAEIGAAVLVSDHVVKNAENRGRWARGSGAKLGRYDGVSYSLELGHEYTPDSPGFVRLIVGKDRLGGVGTTGQRVAELHFEPGDGRTRIEWKPAEDRGDFRPTEIMAKVVIHLRINPGASLTQIRKAVGGKARYVDLAVHCLIEDDDARLEEGGRGKANRYYLIE
jgi:hypothetical protein